MANDGVGVGDAQTASRLLLTVYGDYWFGRCEYVPSRGLVALLAEFGVGEAAGRAALSRLVRRGCLEGRREGRRTAYRLAPARLAPAMDSYRGLMSFGADPCEWDGQWTCVAFSVPEASRHLRPALRRRLRTLHLGPLFDGLWITPRAPLDAIDRSLTDLAIGDAAVFRVREVARPAGVDLLGAWDLDDLRAAYDDLRGVLDAAGARLRGGALGAHEALVTRTEIVTRWRSLVDADPRLPDELLPDDWPLRRTRHALVATYDALGPLGEERVRQIVGTGPAPAHHRVEDRFGVD
jgi:phenylacetic acid degradation operon negative regulatory protein